MQLHRLLSAISFTSGLLGVGGIGGALDRWTSPVVAIVLLGISAVTGYAAYEESGAARRKEKHTPK